MQALAVPHIQLNDGHVIPQLGLGTYKLTGDDCYRTVSAALELGYRHIDTATLYDNEREVGRAIADSGVLRDDIFVTTKVWPSDYDRVADSIAGSLDRLGLERVDLTLLHWPVPMRGTAPAAWDALIAERAAGRTRSIGVSNFTVAQLTQLIADSAVVPAVNQVELHPELQQSELVAFCAEHGIAREAWGPIARARRELFTAPAVADAAAAHGVTPAQVVLRWHLQRDTIVFPKTRDPERLRRNADVLGFALTADQMRGIDGLDAGLRLGGDPDTYTAGT